MKLFQQTDNYLRKTFSSEILEKHYSILGKLYQNGITLEGNSLERITDFLESYQISEDNIDFEKIGKTSTNGEIGIKIIITEIFEIVKSSTFIRKEVSNPILAKSFAKRYWETIKNNVDRLRDLFYSKDLEIVEVLSRVRNLEAIKNKIDNISNTIERDCKVVTWITYSELCDLVYSVYIYLTRTKDEPNNISKIANLNEEIYGFADGFNMETGEIKCIYGSAVFDLKDVYLGNNPLKIKSIAGKILSDYSEQKEEDAEIEYLLNWKNGKETDNEHAKQVVVCSLIYGILTLLELKYNLNYLKENRNEKKRENIIWELTKILNYCNIPKQYLL